MIPVPNQNSMLPLSFPVDVVGIKQQATVMEDLSDMACYKYRVRFEDGTEDNFTLIEGPELSIAADEKGHEHYANSLLDDLYELAKIEPGLFYYVLPVSIGDEALNVWMVEEEPDPGEKDCVMVSYNRRLQFQLYLANDNDQWKVRELSHELNQHEKMLAAELASTMEVIRGALQLK
jgi:hypothetical protein